MAGWASTAGKRVAADNVFMNNNEPAPAQGNHRWSNNAYATRVFLP